ncbi:hypothetical protein Tco_1090596 [Tanacetum coccineum]|uniref:Uncharacterized protein n=1 Tax=Tanacetum coccineum TaxID=301880 RepID=A0ABQ5I6Q0_9ASTR
MAVPALWLNNELTMVKGSWYISEVDEPKIGRYSIVREYVYGVSRRDLPARIEEHEDHLRWFLELFERGEREEAFASFTRRILAARDMEALSVRYKECNLHGSQEFAAHLRSERMHLVEKRGLKLAVGAMAITQIQSGDKSMNCAAQGKALSQEDVREEKLYNLVQQMEKKEDGSLYFMDRVWVPLMGGRYVLVARDEEGHRGVCQRVSDLCKAFVVLHSWLYYGYESVMVTRFMGSGDGDGRLIGPELVQESNDKGDRVVVEKFALERCYAVSESTGKLYLVKEGLHVSLDEIKARPDLAF